MFVRNISIRYFILMQRSTDRNKEGTKMTNLERNENHLKIKEVLMTEMDLIIPFLPVVDHMYSLF